MVVNFFKECTMFNRKQVSRWIRISANILLAVTFMGLALNAAPLDTAKAGRNPPPPPEVGIVLPSSDQPRWVNDAARLTAAFADAGHPADVRYSEESTITELAQVNALIAEGIKVLIICPVDSENAAAAAEAAHNAGIKVISYDRLILNTTGLDFLVTFDNFAVGAQMGQFLVDKAQGGGYPLFLYAGHPGDNNAFLFFEGSWSVLQPKIADGTFVVKNSSMAVSLKDKPSLTHNEQEQIIAQITTNWNWDDATALAQANLAALTAADKGRAFILAPNDGTARAIADVFSADADISSYVITGQDAEQPSVQWIIDGKQSMTIFKDVRTLADDAAATAVDYLNLTTPPSNNTFYNGSMDVPAKTSATVVVDRYNLKAALIDSGYYALGDFTWPTFNVGIVLPDIENSRWVQDGNRLTTAFAAAGRSAHVLYSGNDNAVEKANVDILVNEEDINVLIFAPVDSSAAAAAAADARAAGVKVIAYDRLILDTPAVDYHVTFDSQMVGAAQAQYLVDRAHGTGNPLFLYAGAITDNNAFLFLEGSWSVLQPKIADGTFVVKNSSAAVALKDKATLTHDELVQIIDQIGVTDWDPANATTLAQANLDALTAGDKGRVFILAPNDGTARAIADVFRADTDVIGCVITGQDAERGSVQYIIDGKQWMTVFKDIRTLADDAAAAANLYLTSGHLPLGTAFYNNGSVEVPSDPTDVVVVDRRNVKPALIGTGYYLYSDFIWPTYLPLVKR
jgi:putative multiple sugar transport system substrate-binding protein